MLPLTLLLITRLLFLATRGWMQTMLFFATQPFATAGSIWLLAALNYNMSPAVWVGIIAVAGVAAQTGIVMIVNLDEAFERHRR